MPMYLGGRSVTGTPSRENPLGTGFWTCAFTPAVLGWTVASEVYHIAVSGPAGSNLQLWLDSTFYDFVARGDINSWDPSQPMAVYPGQTLFFHWNTGDGAPPVATVFGRQP